MNEIKIFYNKERTSEVKGDIRFDPVAAGEKTEAILFIYNNTDFPINLGMNLIGDDVNLTKLIKNLKAHETKEIKLVFDPNLTKMKPINAKLEIKLDYIIT